jgi:WD40 repeat protein
MKNPYPGLRPFRQDESHLFFGRDGQTDEILARLGREHFVAIVGVSGCGKSSLVNAGVFPGLHGGLLPTGQREWRIARLQPRNQPIRNLAAALLAAGACAADESSDPRSLVEGVLHSSAQGLGDLVRGRLSAEGANSCALLIVVDQFEEIFRFSRSGASGEASQFVQLLLEAIRKTEESQNQSRPLPLYVALAMRSDFLGDCAVFPGLPERINRSQYLVPRMSLLQREKAISRPAATEEAAFARPLLDRLLDDVGDDPDQLPILQHALQRTWEAWLRRTGGKGDVGLEDYLAPEVGGMAGAISNHAEEAFGSLGSHPAKVPAGGQPALIDPDGKTFSRQQRLAGALFRCVTEQAEDRRAVRRALSLETIAKIANVPVADMAPIIDAFRTQQRTFLTPPEGVPLEAETLIDISHESLIRNWPRLARWAAQESLAAGELRRLRHSAAAFLQGNQDPLDRLELARVERWQKGIFPDDLLAEPQIVPSADWARLYLGPEAPEVFSQIQSYIRESQENLRRRRRKDLIGRATRWALIALLFLGAVVWRLRSEKRKAEDADEKRRDAEKRLEVAKTFAKTADSLADPIISNTGSALDKAELQAEKLIADILQAAPGQPPDAAMVEEQVRRRDAADRAADDMDTLAESIKSAANLTGVENLVATAANLKRDASDFKKRREALLQKNEPAFKAIRSSIALRLKQAEDALGGLLNTRPLDPAVVKTKSKEFSAASAAADAVIALGEAAMALGIEEARFKDVTTRFQAVVTTLNEIQELNSAPIRQVAILEPKTAVTLKHAAKVSRVHFAPGSPVGGPLIAAACADGAVWLWRPDGTKIGTIVTESAVNDIAFSPRADSIAVAGDGTAVRVFRLGGLLNSTSLKEVAFERNGDSVTDVEFSHGGERIASASADGTVRVFDSRSMAQVYFTSPPLKGIVTSVRFHRGDNLIVSSCDDGGINLHTIDPPGIKLLGTFQAPARRAEFSPDGKLVVAASGDKTVRIWPIRPDYGFSPIRVDHPTPVTQATFRPVSDAQGYAVATCATNGEVRIVRFPAKPATRPAPPDITVLAPRHPGSVLSAIWSTDGRWLASVGGGEVLVWEWMADSLALRMRLSGLNAGTWRAEFSPDDTALVTYGGDDVASVWNMPNAAAP